MVSTYAGTQQRESIDGDISFASFAGIFGIAVDQKCGYIYVSEWDSGKIRKVSQTGTFLQQHIIQPKWCVKCYYPVFSQSYS